MTEKGVAPQAFEDATEQKIDYKKRYWVVEHEGEKIVEFSFLAHPAPSITEFIKIVEEEFPGVPLTDLNISSGDEAFFVKKREK